MNSGEMVCGSGVFDDAYIAFGFDEWLSQQENAKRHI
jgi:hypothetical protein